MRKLIAECIECSNLMISEKQDGIRCYECGGMTSPIGYVTDKAGRRMNQIDKERREKMILRLKNKITSEDYGKVKAKLEDNFKERVILLPNDIELVSNIYEIKEDDIRITDASLKTESIFCSSGMIEHLLIGTEVSFEYKDINSNLFIESKKLLTVKEMKRAIINRFSIKEINVKEDM
ncbi:hypothetical protein ACQPUZ_04800 [Clostridium tertium]